MDDEDAIVSLHINAPNLSEQEIRHLYFNIHNKDFNKCLDVIFEMALNQSKNKNENENQTQKNNSNSNSNHNHNNNEEEDEVKKNETQTQNTDNLTKAKTKTKTEDQESIHHQTDMQPLFASDLEFPSKKPFEISWELLKKIRYEKRFEQFHRTQATNEEYQKHKKEVLQTYDQLSSFLLEQVFGLKLVKIKDTTNNNNNSNNGLLTHDVSMELGKQLKWRANQFPYNFSKDMQHDLLWCTVSLSKQEILDEIAKNVPADHLIIWWINLAKFKSVPGLYHVQIVHKKQT